MAQGVLTALQAALAGVSGGITGAQQYREMEQKRKREEEAAQMQQDAFTLSMIQAQGGTLGAPITSSAMPARPPGGTTLQRAVATGETATAPPPAQMVKIRGMEFPVVTAQDKLRMADDQFERSIAGLTDEQKQMARMARVGIPASAMVPREPRQPRRELIKETGQIVDIDTGETIKAKDYLVPPKTTGRTVGLLDTGERALLSQAQTNARNSADEFQKTLQDRPRQKDFVNQLTMKPDKAAFAEATQRWAAGDSTFAARRMAADQAELERLKADLGVAAPAAPAAGRGNRLPTGDAESALSSRAQQKIAEIQGSDHTPEEKQQKIQEVNAILAREIAKIRGVGR